MVWSIALAFGFEIVSGIELNIISNLLVQFHYKRHCIFVSFQAYYLQPLALVFLRIETWFLMCFYCFQLCRLGSDYMKEIPIVVRPHIKSLLNIAPGVRPDANQTIKVSPFQRQLSTECLIWCRIPFKHWPSWFPRTPSARFTNQYLSFPSNEQRLTLWVFCASFSITFLHSS